MRFFTNHLLLFRGVGLFLLLACSYNGVATYEFPAHQKIKGLSFVSPPEPCDTLAYNKTVALNAEWVALMPYAFFQNSTGKLFFNMEKQWWGEKSEGIIFLCQQAKRKGLKVMIKPQIWAPGLFTGDITFTSESSWKKFENDYRAFIATFATIAQEQEVELFCIGNELYNFTSQRESYWGNLISEIRTIYKGELTYAENWDKYHLFKHWNKLDFIGVNAYFPLSKKKTPQVNELISSWKNYVSELQSVAMSTKKQILFTEIGYRSIDRCAEEPWEHEQRRAVNEQAQANCFAALFKALWQHNWFAGIFIWKQFPDQHIEKPEKDDYTIDNKLAEQIVRIKFGEN